MLTFYLPGTKGIILVYSDDIEHSIQYLEGFLELLQNYLAEKIPIILLKAKADISSENSKSDKIENFLQCKDIKSYFITSARTGMNVPEVFQNILELILKNEKSV